MTDSVPCVNHSCNLTSYYTILSGLLNIDDLSDTSEILCFSIISPDISISLACNAPLIKAFTH